MAADRRRRRALVAVRAARAAGKPRVSYPPELPVAQRAGGHRRGDPRAPGRHRLRRDGLGQDDAAAEDLPRRRPRRARADRPHAAAPHRRARGRRRASRRSSARALGDAVGYKVRFTDQHAARRVRQADDRRHPARRDAGRPRPRALRHDHRRRGARAQPQHRFPARLPASACSPRRPDLKVIITSATIDAERFARHFATRDGPAPVIEVSGRTYPVDVRYRPLALAATSEADDEEELEDAIVDAAEDLWREGPGDILVFLPGEREIRETARRCCGARSRAARTRARSRSCRCTRACRSPSSSACSRRRAAGASCSRPTSPRRRSRCRASAT